MESKLKAQRTADEAKPDAIGHKPYEHQEYPKWLYNANGESALVHSGAERNALIGIWAESPKEAEALARKAADEASKAKAAEAKAQADAANKPKPARGADEASKAAEAKA